MPSEPQRKSTFGEQTTRASAPAFGFGASTRDQEAVRYLSKEHAKLGAAPGRSPGPAKYVLKATVGGEQATLATYPRWAFSQTDRWQTAQAGKYTKQPGPGTYEAMSSMGVQADGKKASNPSYSSSRGTREGASKVFISNVHSDAIAASCSPGPIYTMRSSIEPQDQSTKTSMPAWVFGKDRRFTDPFIKMKGRLPAPNAYAMPAGLGPQPDRTSAPVVGFGTATREHFSRVFLSAEHEKGNHGQHGPGPKYMQLASVGPQPLSGVGGSKKQTPSYSFGTCDRFHTSKAALRHSTPGPDAYNV